MIHVWDLIKKFMRDTEIANNIIFTNSAWQRAKQLEKDIQARDNESDAEHRALMTRAREDADRVGAARMAFEEQQQKRIETAEGVLDEIYANARMIVETQTEMKLPQWKLIKMIVDRIESHKKANGPG